MRAVWQEKMPFTTPPPARQHRRNKTGSWTDLIGESSFGVLPDLGIHADPPECMGNEKRRRPFRCAAGQALVSTTVATAEYSMRAADTTAATVLDWDVAAMQAQLEYVVPVFPIG